MDCYSLFIAFTLILTVTLIPAIDAAYYPVPRPVGSFGEGAPIYGIYRIKDNLTIIRDSATHVEVYDVRGRNDWIGKLEVAGMTGPYDMVGSDDSRSLFITDWFDWSNIATVSTKAQNQVGRFPLGENFTVVGMAATKSTTTNTADSDVVVTCTQSLKIKEFTKFGEVVRQIQIPSGITQPRHTIKLTSGKGYAVCHGYGPVDKHRVCLLDNSGTETDCFGDVAGSGKDRLDVCARIAEDDNGDIIVADRNNKRVILLSNKNGKLKFVQEILREKDGLNGPIRVFIDGPILYVVDNTYDQDGLAIKGKVLAFRVKDGPTNF